MGVAYSPGQTLSRGDLDIYLTNSSGNPTNVYAITYGLYWVEPVSEVEVLIGSDSRVPTNPAVGEYYAAVVVPATATPGDYRIRWTFQETSATPPQVVVQEFAVVGIGSITGGAAALSGCQADLVRKLRFMLRDNNPDRNYRFRPPESEGTIGCFNQVFGYIWEDEELLEFLKIALDKWNSAPPETEELCNLDILCQRKPAWKAAILWGAIVNAAMALSFNWIADEFSISPETMVRVVLPDGREVDVAIGDLYDACHGGGVTMDPAIRAAIREAFRSGQLQVHAVNPETGEVGLHRVSDVLRHETPHKAMVRTTLLDGRSVETTVDHSLFHCVGRGVVPVEAAQLRVGEAIATVSAGAVEPVGLLSTEILPAIPYTYDLSVPGPQNFTLANGILAHNSYSIGGISLDIDKSGKYQGLKENAESQWDKLTEFKRATTKYLRGLKQPRFGIGVRSAFGPNLGRGIMSPRKFM